MPSAPEHFFCNETRDQDALAVGFCVGAKSVQDTGCAFRGDVTEADM